MFICEKKDAVMKFNDILRRLNESSNYLHYNLDMKVVSELSDLIGLPDMHDRIIVATARLNKAILITKDEKIIKSNLVDAVWN